MLKRALEIVLAPFDWCWPFPLGIVFAALVVGASAGAWRMFREPPAPRHPPLQKNAAPRPQSPAHSEVAPPPSEPAPPAPTESMITTEAPPVEPTKTSSASATSQLGPATNIPSPESPQPGSMDSSARNGKSPTPSPRLEKSRVASESKAPPTGSRPLAPEEAKRESALIRGRWYMKQGQYRAALEEYQAVLKMDPSNREARAGLQRARDAMEIPKPAP